MAQFQPGQSGNTRGRPKGSGGKKSKLRKLQNILEDITPDAIQKIHSLMLSADKHETQLNAAKYIVGTYVDVRVAVVEDEVRLNGKESDVDGEEEEIATKTGAVLKLSLTP
jgi:hypothetical protein